jgi:hypothetical protein
MTAEYTWPQPDEDASERLTSYRMDGPAPQFGADLMFVKRTQTWFWSVWSPKIKEVLTSGTSPTREAAKDAVLTALNRGRLVGQVRRRALAEVEW